MKQGEVKRGWVIGLLRLVSISSISSSSSSGNGGEMKKTRLWNCQLPERGEGAGVEGEGETKK